MNLVLDRCKIEGLVGPTYLPPGHPQNIKCLELALDNLRTQESQLVSILDKIDPGEWLLLFMLNTIRNNYLF